MVSRIIKHFKMISIETKKRIVISSCFIIIVIDVIFILSASSNHQNSAERWYFYTIIKPFVMANFMGKLDSFFRLIVSTSNHNNYKINWMNCLWNTFENIVCRRFSTITPYKYQTEMSNFGMFWLIW